MRQIVKPIKDSWVLRSVQESLLKDFDLGFRNYTIFQTGKATLLRVIDVLRLRKSHVYDERGRVKKNAYIIDKKTEKNTLYLNPIRQNLKTYYNWLKKWQKGNPTLGYFFLLSVPRSTLMSGITT